MTAVLKRRVDPREILAGLTVVAGRSPVVGVLGIGLLIAVAIAASQIMAFPWRDHWLGLGAIALAVAALFELVVRLARREAPVAVVPFFLMTLVAGITLRLAYVHLVQPEWYTDFLRYWTYGLQLAAGQISEIDSVYSQRAYFLTLPLIELFGDSPKIVPVANALVLTAVQVLGYDTLRRIRSHQAAQGFVVLWMVVPEPLMASAVPNHDLAGLLLIISAIWLCVMAWARPGLNRNTLIFWFASGLVLGLLEAVRGLGLIVLLTIALLAAATLVVAASKSLRGFSARTRHIGLAVLIIGAGFLLMGGVLRLAGATMDAATHRHLMLRYTTPHATSLSSGSYSFMYAFEKAFMLDLAKDPEAFSGFRRSLVVSDFLNDPLDRIQASAAKLERQYSLGTQQNFYMRAVPWPIPTAMKVLNAFFVVAFALLLLRSIQLLARHRERQLSLDHFLLLSTAITSLILIVMGESQPRYLSAIWLAGAMVIPSQLSYRDGSVGHGPSPVRLVASSVLFLGTLLAVIWVLGSLFFTYGKGRILDSWAYSVGGGDRTKGAEYLAGAQSLESNVLLGRGDQPLPISFGKLSLKLVLSDVPATARYALAEQTVCGLDSREMLAFHYDFPAKRLDGLDAFQLQVLVDGKAIWSRALPNAGRPAGVSVPFNVDSSGCARIGFRLLATNDQTRASWQRASRVEVFFPRIVASPAG